MAFQREEQCLQSYRGVKQSFKFRDSGFSGERSGIWREAGDVVRRNRGASLGKLL